MTEYCCKELKDQIKKGQIEFSEKYGWNVPGCCGGGCWVLREIKFCPYCGTKLSPPVKA